MFKIGIFLNKLEKNPFPLICLIEINFDFNLSQFMQLPITYGLLFLVIFPLTFLLLVFSLQDKQNIRIIYYNHINSFFKKSLELNKVKKFIKSFLLLMLYKTNRMQYIPHKLLEIS